MRAVVLIVVCMCTCIVVGGGMLACADEEPRFGPPGSIRDRNFGSSPVTTTSGEGGAPSKSVFKTAFDPANPPPAGDPLGPRHPTPLSDQAECTSCHNVNGQALSKPWQFGGRVNHRVPSNTAIREVIVLTNTGEILAHVKTTADGYFWSAGSPPVTGVHTAVRTSSGEEAEMASSANGGCNAAGSCHGAPATGPIYVPK